VTFGLLYSVVYDDLRWPAFKVIRILLDSSNAISCTVGAAVNKISTDLERRAVPLLEPGRVFVDAVQIIYYATFN